MAMQPQDEGHTVVAIASRGGARMVITLAPNELLNDGSQVCLHALPPLRSLYIASNGYEQRSSWPPSEQWRMPPSLTHVGAGAPPAAVSAGRSTQPLAHYMGVGPSGTAARRAYVELPMTLEHLRELAARALGDASGSGGSGGALVAAAAAAEADAASVVALVFRVVTTTLGFVRLGSAADSDVSKKRVYRFVHEDQPLGVRTAAEATRYTMYVPAGALLLGVASETTPGIADQGFSARVALLPTSAATAAAATHRAAALVHAVLRTLLDGRSTPLDALDGLCLRETTRVLRASSPARGGLGGIMLRLCGEASSQGTTIEALIRALEARDAQACAEWCAPPQASGDAAAGLFPRRRPPSRGRAKPSSAAKERPLVRRHGTAAKRGAASREPQTPLPPSGEAGAPRKLLVAYADMVVSMRVACALCQQPLAPGAELLLLECSCRVACCGAELMQRAHAAGEACLGGCGLPQGTATLVKSRRVASPVVACDARERTLNL